MVLENLYPAKLIEKSFFYAFFLGIAYSVIGIGAAVVIFPQDPTLVSLTFITIMMYPTINSIIKEAEKRESEKIETTLSSFFKDNERIFKVYLLFFLAVFFVFALFSIYLPNIATNHIFKTQVDILYGKSVGSATGLSPLFHSIIVNNFIVLLICFVSAFAFGDGGIFLISWNASVWGTIFGILAKSAAYATNKNPLFYFFIIFAIVFAHMILEAFSYICAASTGGILSKCFIKEKFWSNKSKTLIANTLIVLFLSIIILVLAVTIETYVLQNSTLYQTVVSQSGI